MKIKNLKLKIIILFLFSLLFAIPSFAQTSTPSASSLPSTIYHLPSTVSPTSPVYTDLLVHNLFHTFSCLSVGSSVIGQPCLTYQLTQNARGVIQSVPVLSSVNLSGGALGATTSIIGALYMNPPIRTVNYLASVGEGLGIVKEANAQVVGSGAAVLDPILKLWQVSRNIAYLAMIIIFIIIGLMVMFRQRINPQTVITVQAALPGLVIGLILITFSYFLAALLVDTAFIGTWLVGYYFQPVTNSNTATVMNTLQSNNVLNIFSQFSAAPNTDQFTQAVGPIIANIQGTARSVLNGALFFLGCQYGQQFADPAAKAIGAAGAINPVLQLVSGGVSIAGCVGTGTWVLTNPDSALGFFIFLVVVIILLLQMIKLLMKLINNYIVILFLTLTAPFQFLAASLPGRQGIATKWITSMLCNILAFPAVFAAFYFAAYILGGAVSTSFGVSTGTNLGSQTLPLLGGFSQSLVRFLIAFGVLVAIPSIPDIICRSLGAASQAGQLIGQEISEARKGGQQQLGQTGANIGNLGSSVGGAFHGYAQTRRLQAQFGATAAPRAPAPGSH